MDQGLRRKLEIAFSFLLFAALLAFFLISLSYPPRPVALPRIINIAGLVLVGIQLGKAILTPATGYKKPARAMNWKPILFGFAFLTVYVIAAYFLGIVFASPILIYGCGRAFGSVNRKALIILSAAIAVVLYVVFEFALRVVLYRGIFFS